MDDSDRSAIIPSNGIQNALKTIGLVGILVFLGAGCAKTNEQIPSTVTSASSQSEAVVTSTVGLSPTRTYNPSGSKRSVTCYEQLAGKDERRIWEELTKLETSGGQDVAPSVQSLKSRTIKQLESGWKIDTACIQPIVDTSGDATLVLVLTKTSATVDDLKMVAHVIDHRLNKKPTVTDFKDSQFFNLVQIYWAGGESDSRNPYVNGIADSGVLAINGGPNQPGHLEELSLAFNAKTDEPIITAKARGGDYSYYVADITFTPWSKKLTTKICDHDPDPKSDDIGKYLPIICH